MDAGIAYAGGGCTVCLHDPPSYALLEFAHMLDATEWWLRWWCMVVVGALRWN